MSWGWERVHILSSPEPLTFGGDVRAACGKVVPSAVAIDAVCACKNCWEKFKPDTYQYALISGEESMRVRM